MAHERAGRNIEFVIADFPTWQVDPGLMQQVFVNLISNAVKFTREREKARIEIGYRMDGTTLVCFVKDNGVGFNMKYMNKLFGVFQRLHSADQFEGTGVGLSIVRRIVERHGGKVWVDGEQDQGATFFFSLPDSSLPDARERALVPAGAAQVPVRLIDDARTCRLAETAVQTCRAARTPAWRATFPRERRRAFRAWRRPR